MSVKKIIIFTFSFILTLAVSSIICFILLFVYLSRPYEEDVDVPDYYTSHYYIAHAGGQVNGLCYTNSMEALLESIKKGFKYIELDLYLTSDSDVVCLHKLEDYNKMTGKDVNQITTKDFKKTKIYGKYTPITLLDAVHLWEQNDFIIVTDKISDTMILNKYFIHNRNNVFVEAFSATDYKSLKEAGYTPMLSTQKDIKGFILYLIARISLGRIEMVTVSVKTKPEYARVYRRLGSKVLLYTLNTDYQIRKVLGKEADMIYVDSYEFYRHK